MNRIKELREEKGWTQAELAEKLDLAAGTVGLYEQGRRSPSVKILNQMSKMFDACIEYILGKTPVRLRPSNIKSIPIESPPKGYFAERLLESALQDDRGKEMLKMMIQEKLAEISLPRHDTETVKAFGKMMASLKDDDTKKIRLEIIKVVSEAEFTVEQLLAIHSFLRSFIPK